MKEFFWWCAGVHQKTLQQFPQEHNKYVSIGATIFFTGLFAALAGGYALYFVFSGNDFAGFMALLFGGIWGLAIFNLDRYIVLSMDKSRSTSTQVLQALPRILLAILIGLVISRPLELKIFEKEIQDYLRNEYLTLQSARIDTLNKTFENKYHNQHTQLAQLKTQSDSLEASIKTERQRFNHELFGTKTDQTSGIMGYGPYAKMKEAQLDRQEFYLDSLHRQISAHQDALMQRKSQEGLLNLSIHSEQSLDSVVNLAGFADRNAALSKLHIRPDGSVNQSTEYAVFFITLLFIFFECLPVFVKLMSARDAYDHALKNQKEIHNYASDADVVVEKSVTDKIQDHRINSAVQQKCNN
ncbi:MAG: DUF4407 domain-containing protein [Sphingobacterium sp.]